MATAAYKPPRTRNRSRWLTVRIPPYRERNGTFLEGARYLREKKFTKDQLIALSFAMDFGLDRGDLYDPSAPLGANMDKAVTANTDDLSEFICRDLPDYSRQQAMADIDLFVEYGLIQGLELRKKN